MSTLTNAPVLTREQAAGILARLGFPVSPTSRFDQSLGGFQAGWNLGPALTIDEELGPKTSAALAVSELRRKSGKATASEHFSFAEFACRCGGGCSGCLGVLVLRPLLVGLEALRAAHYPHGLTVVGPYRCPSRNRTVGGKVHSQHQYGAACDVAPVASTDAVRALGVFSGIGFGGKSGLVRHVDVRGQAAGTGRLAAAFAAPNFPDAAGTRGKPMTWIYADD